MVSGYSTISGEPIYATDLAKAAPPCAKAALAEAMKMFLSAFAGAFCAILVSAGALYLIKDYQETQAARERLRDAVALADRSSRIARLPASEPESTPEEKPIPPTPQFYPKLVKAVTVKTMDGEITLPAGKIVQIADEKSKPGTVVINHDGYMITIPATSVALSR